MSSVKFVFNGYEELTEAVEKVEKAAPDYMRAAIVKAGNDFKKDAVTKTRLRTQKKTGNLLAGYKSTVVLKAGSLRSFEAQVNGGNRKAFHFHLLEHGHKRYEQMFPKVHGGGRGKGKLVWYKSSAGFTKGFHMMEDTIDEWEDRAKIISYAEKAINKALKEGLI